MHSPLPLQEIERNALKLGSPTKALEFLREQLKGDRRTGAVRLLGKYEKQIIKENQEIKRLQELWKYEKTAQEKGFKLIAGIDEAGRGPLAGPVVAAAVILPHDITLTGVDDSKKLSAFKREELFDRIHQTAVAIGLGLAGVDEIDRINIYQAAQLAMERAIEALNPRPDYLLTDAMPLPRLSSFEQKALIHGDALSATIAAASIIAKVTRDRLMGELHQKFPVYGFENHKGYGTEEHLRALAVHGICPEHRLSFAPVMETVAKKTPGGPFGYWREKLMCSKNLRELQQTGIQIKKLALAHLKGSELETLRDLFRIKKRDWEHLKS